MRAISIETSIHGRVLIREATVASSAKRFFVGFHGYAQSAEDILSQLELVPGAEKWTIVAVQALHRFYARGHKAVIASWMTSQDREQAIADNIVYVNRALGPLLVEAPEAPIVFAGFSQGVAMAYRAAILGTHRPRWVVAVGGDVPPDVRVAPANCFPSILIAAGESDEWYTPEKLQADAAFLAGHGVTLEVFRYRGAHEWTAELRHRIHEVLQRLL